MIAMRALVLCSLPLLAACAAWNPDHEPDPQQQLDRLLPATEADAAALDANQREELRQTLERLAARHTNHVPTQVAAAAMAFADGDVQRAAGLVERVLELAPANVEARSLRIRLAVADGGMELAQRLVDDGLRLRPDAAALHESQAWLHQLACRQPQALAALALAERLGAPAWRVEFHRGLLAEQAGDDDAARQHYRRVRELQPDCEPATQRLRALAARNGKPAQDG
jgi:tetratricopeptide (TPR) repeat protein